MTKRRTLADSLQRATIGSPPFDTELYAAANNVQPRRTISISIATITAEHRLRATLDPAIVDALAESIDATGLQTPILVRPYRAPNTQNPSRWGKASTGAYALITGAHRLAAVKSLDHTHIEALIVDAPPHETRLIEIDENLIRADLTPLDRARFLAARKKIYDQIHPTTKRGGDHKSARYKKQVHTNPPPAPTFAVDTSGKIGLTDRTVRRAIEIGNGLTDELTTVLIGTPLATREADLHQLAGLSAAKQRKIAKHIAATTTPPNRARDLLPPTNTAHPSPTTPETNPIQQAWLAATPSAQRAFLTWLNKTTNIHHGKSICDDP